MIMTEKRIPYYMHIIFLTKNIRNFCSLSEPDFYTNWDEKEESVKRSVEKQLGIRKFMEIQDDINC